jgi:hypothetical protein
MEGDRAEVPYSFTLAGKRHVANLGVVKDEQGRARVVFNQDSRLLLTGDVVSSTGVNLPYGRLLLPGVYPTNPGDKTLIMNPKTMTVLPDHEYRVSVRANRNTKEAKALRSMAAARFEQSVAQLNAQCDAQPDGKGCDWPSVISGGGDGLYNISYSTQAARRHGEVELSAAGNSKRYLSGEWTANSTRTSVPKAGGADPSVAHLSIEYRVGAYVSKDGKLGAISVKRVISVR